MSIISPLGSNSKCFGGLATMNYDISKPYGERISYLDGVFITYYGNTTKTDSNNNCFMNAIGYLLPQIPLI